ncbi:protein tilB homolog [Lingula anatina]|uniref:Protein tilB homolog n=1 Tax=Lingula anatina TaxID=7574 RepID=A0A1S3I2A1_LINAN|nr:protein tilB homolog [Lingula anatina]|eukprot:XP_013391474.1 protein tilB homolog [Lingula anatina]
MVRITELLVRKRSEHNEGEIYSLEELSLHQQDIEKIENLDKWCRELKILYLQSNLIPKIENVGRLKKLEYLNLALNNVERVENLEGCESLQKLDLTVNFVGELTSIECLVDLPHFRELFLTGNPCTNYDGYRDYVIATLKNLQQLDGQGIEKSERIKAIQEYSEIRNKIIRQQNEYMKKREKEREEELKKQEGKNKVKQEHKPGFDGRWYTDINNTLDVNAETQINETINDSPKNDEKNREELEKEFWEEKVPFTPESRMQVHEHLQELKKRDEKKDESKQTKQPRRLMTDNGQMLNVNEAKIDFSLTDDEENNQYVLDVSTYKYLDTSLLDVDVQPTYVRVTIKGKVLQLVLEEEVKADSSKARRSQTTGHLLISMPKAKHLIQARKVSPPKQTFNSEPKHDGHKDNKMKTVELLEVAPNGNQEMDFGNIVKEKTDVVKAPFESKVFQKPVERPNSEDFVDDPDVPPLL